jgi:leucyl/phenylalanyl-tRNA--protein transferase
MSGMPGIRDADGNLITPELVIQAYWQGCFPMADHRDGRLRWYRPSHRAIITWDSWKVPRSLEKVARKEPYRLSIDRDFDAVVAACSERASTWISPDIEQLYGALHRLGHAHSVEAWSADGLMVGGLYGIALGACFCGESMFHRADDAAKLCVMHLVARLQARGFTVLDCQQQTPHMQRFGAFEIGERDYAALLAGCHRHCAFP